MPSPSQPAEPFTELKVAYINLLSPVSTDLNDPTPAETFEQRLAIVIEQLKALKPDIVGVSEVTWTRANGSARERLVKELKMEVQYVRANPWFPGQTRDENDALVKQIGFEEGDAILSKFPILRAEQGWLNPRTSETEGRAVLHVVVKLPDPYLAADVYVTHLTGGGERVRKAQADDVLAFIRKTRGLGPTLLLADLSEPADSAVASTFTSAGLQDIAIVGEGEPGYPTCCRTSVIGEQPALTVRHDFIFAERLGVPFVTVFANEPVKQANGTLLYASDHNGLFAVFPISTPETTERAE
jgi:endonuclease/exonuclease/phosphatase family metal-dependent hydrolase